MWFVEGKAVKTYVESIVFVTKAFPAIFGNSILRFGEGYDGLVFILASITCCWEWDILFVYIKVISTF